MISSIRQRYQRYGWSSPAGEWGLIQADGRNELHHALDAADDRELDAVLSRMFRGELAYGLVSMPEDLARTLPQQISWRLALWCKVIDVPDVERLRAPDVGSPVVLHVHGVAGAENVPVMPDAMRFDNYARRIAAVAPDVVMELGSGYGGVALQLLRSSAAQLVLCDLPETLYLAGYWLSESTDKRVDWWDADPSADVVLLPAHELRNWRGHADLVFSSHSLSGMDTATIADYMTWLDEHRPRYFYHDDVVEKVEGIWMTSIIPETLATDIKPPACYVERWRERTPWMGINDRFCEFFYELAT